MRRMSVVIDTYNQEGFIAEAIESVLAQDFPREQMEILVVDDGSTDRTPEIVRQFEPQVKLLRKANGGQASAINFGAAHASGEIVAFLDGDDVWLPQKLSRVAEEFRKHPEVVMVYHAFAFWDMTSGREWQADWPLLSGDIPGDRRKLHAYCAAPTSSLAFRLDVLRRIVPVPEQCSFMHDSLLVSAAIFLGAVAALPDCLTKNRVHGSNLWFAEGGAPAPETLRGRIASRRALIESVRKWMATNVPESSLPKAEVLIRRWELLQASDGFGLEAPSRLRLFVHLCRQLHLDAPGLPPAEIAFRAAKTLTFLIVGQRAHYLEGVRTRVKKLASHSHAAGMRAEKGRAL